MKKKEKKKIKGNKRVQLKDLNNLHNNVDVCFLEVKSLEASLWLKYAGKVLKIKAGIHNAATANCRHNHKTLQLRIM